MSDGAAFGATEPAAPAPWWARPGASATSVLAQTSTDKRLYIEGGLVPVTCGSCSTQVLVKKNSRAHTSIQWTCDAAASCPHIGEQVATGTRAARVLSCPQLMRSIENAVRSGAVTMSDD